MSRTPSGVKTEPSPDGPQTIQAREETRTHATAGCQMLLTLATRSPPPPPPPPPPPAAT